MTQRRIEKISLNYAIQNFAKTQVEFFKNAGYPLATLPFDSYDEKLHDELLFIINRYSISKNVNELKEGVNQLLKRVNLPESNGSFPKDKLFPNCVQITFLLSLKYSSSIEQLMSKINIKKLIHIHNEGFKGEEESYNTILLNQTSSKPKVKNMDVLMGSTIFIFGTSLVGFYTSNNKVLTLYQDENNESAFKEVDLNVLMEHIFSDYQRLRCALVSLVYACDNRGDMKTYKKLIEYIDFLENKIGPIDDDERYKKQKQKIIKDVTQRFQKSLIRVSDPITTIDLTSFIKKHKTHSKSKRSPIKNFTRKQLKKFENASYPPSSWEPSYDEKIDIQLSILIENYKKSNNSQTFIKGLDQLLARINLPKNLKNDSYPKEKLYPNCWQMTLLLNLKNADPIEETLNKINEYDEDCLLDEFKRDEYYMNILKDKKPLMGVPLKNQKIQFGSTVFLCGTSHIAFYTSDGRVLSQWYGNKKIVGFKEVKLEDLLKHIYSDYSLFTKSLSSLAQELDVEGDYETLERLQKFMLKLEYEIGSNFNNEEEEKYNEKKEKFVKNFINEFGEKIIRCAAPIAAFKLTKFQEYLRVSNNRNSYLKSRGQPTNHTDLNNEEQTNNSINSDFRKN